ncbi:MAG: hypothetical protein IT434_01940 [Phycisphaerales bacterium]|nr:hypothetical protein [Phycisphaerales bacterium]
MHQARRAFTRADLVAVVVCLFMGFVVLVVPLQDGAMRDIGRIVCSHRLGAWRDAVVSYTYDNQDAFPTFAWKPGSASSLSRESGTGLQELRAQALEKVRRFAGRDDITAPDDWLPQPHFSWLVLYEAGQRGVLEALQCPEDRQGALVELDNRRADGAPPSVSEFASTFEFVPSMWSPDSATPYTDGAFLPVVEPGLQEGEYRVPSGRPFGLRPRRMEEVAFPSRKVLVFDPFDRHSAPKKRHYANPAASQPLLMADGSVQWRQTADANPGGLPNDPSGKAVPVFDSAWQIDPWEIRTDNVREVRGYYRWTAGGLAGVDFDAPQHVRKPFDRRLDSTTWATCKGLP